MAATVTLATTTLSSQVLASDSAISVASTSGLSSGMRLYVDRELMLVFSLGLGTLVNVARGVDGTASSAHAPGAIITIGRGDQFYLQDPVGRPPDTVLVSPWINVVNGQRWVAQGDEVGPGSQSRYWQAEVDSRVIGALGVRDPIVTTP